MINKISVAEKIDKEQPGLKNNFFGKVRCIALAVA